MGKRKRQVAVVLPAVESTTVELSDTPSDGGPIFRKKILPDATIQYPKTARHPGGPVTFDAAFRKTLIDAFNAGAYDHPPLQWATADNAHNMLPERTGGHIVGLSEAQPGDVDGPGLYADVRPLTKKDAKLLRKNPHVGVSPEIVQGLHTVHQQKFPVALRHLLATLDPRVRKLGPWRTVSLSDEKPGTIIDLSGANYEEHTSMAKSKGKGKGRDADVLTLSDDDLEAALQAAADELEQIELSDDLAALGDAGDTPTVLALAADLEATRGEMLEQRAMLAASNWQAERARYQSGDQVLSRAVLDLAAPLLSSVGEAVIQLSDTDGDTVIDPRQVVRDILTCVQAGHAVIDLSDADGSSLELADNDGGPGDALKNGLSDLSNRFGD